MGEAAILGGAGAKLAGINRPDTSSGGPGERRRDGGVPLRERLEETHGVALNSALRRRRGFVVAAARTRSMPSPHIDGGGSGTGGFMPK